MTGLDSEESALSDRAATPREGRSVPSHHEISGATAVQAQNRSTNRGDCHAACESRPESPSRPVGATVFRQPEMPSGKSRVNGSSSKGSYCGVSDPGPVARAGDDRDELRRGGIGAVASGIALRATGRRPHCHPRLGRGRHRGRAKNYAYGASKAAVHIFVQGLRQRLQGSNVSLTTVKPGFIDTGMTWGLPGLFLVASPEACARRCYRAAQRRRGEIYVPPFWWLIMTVIRSIPEPIFNRMRF